MVVLKNIFWRAEWDWQTELQENSDRLPFEFWWNFWRILVKLWWYLPAYMPGIYSSGFHLRSFRTKMNIWDPISRGGIVFQGTYESLTRHWSISKNDFRRKRADCLWGFLATPLPLLWFNAPTWLNDSPSKKPTNSFASSIEAFKSFAEDLHTYYWR